MCFTLFTPDSAALRGVICITLDTFRPWGLTPHYLLNPKRRAYGLPRDLLITVGGERPKGESEQQRKLLNIYIDLFDKTNP